MYLFYDILKEFYQLKIELCVDVDNHYIFFIAGPFPTMPISSYGEFAEEGWSELWHVKIYEINVINVCSPFLIARFYQAE